MTTQTIAQLFDLTGKSAIVTGGAMGIGKGIALRLAEAGASVMITDIDMEVANQTVKEINARGGKAQAIYADSSIVADVQKVTQATVEAFGRLDILVNNAGIYSRSPALQMSEKLWDTTHNINLKGLFFCSQAAAQEMIRAGHSGRIINIASIEAFHPSGNYIHYNTTKAAVVMLTKALAKEFGPHNILVNAVAPGAIGVWRDSKVGAPAQTEEQVAQMKSRFAHLPLRRRGEPDDIAKVVLFLASAAADYMTGTTLLVDGGWLLVGDF